MKFRGVLECSKIFLITVNGMGIEENLEKPGLSDWRNQATKSQPQSLGLLRADMDLRVVSSVGAICLWSTSSPPGYRGVAGK